MKTLKKPLMLFIFTAFAMFSCEQNEPLADREDLSVQENEVAIPEALEQWIREDADKRILELIAKSDGFNSGRVASDCGYAYCTGINYQQGGSSSCTLNITTARNSAVPPFSTLCAAPSNFRYGIVYFGSAAQGAIYGPTGGCLEGSLTYAISGTGSYSQQPSYVLVYNVYNGPGGGATFVGHVSGNAVNTQCL